MTSSRSIDRFRRERAKQLRVDATSAESRLWRALRRSQILGSHFRRQVPIGPYIADFACMAARLVIEVDGPSHAEESNAARDAERTRWLETNGYRVLRFWNGEVYENIDGVLEVIHSAIYGSGDIASTVLIHKRRRRT